MERLKHIKETKYPIYSYSPNDCKKMKVPYRSTVYTKNITLSTNLIEYDAIFLGRIKDRGELIKNLYQEFVQSGISSYFYLLGETDLSEELKVKLKFLEYHKYLDLISKSKAIIDISNPGQDGLSMRVMESLFLNKKLIIA